MVHNRTSVFDQIHSVQLAMTLINFKDSKHWYNEYKDAKWETEIVNIGKGEHLSMLKLNILIFRHDITLPWFIHKFSNQRCLEWAV